MFSYFYNWYYYSPQQIDYAQEQIIFFKDRIASINDKTNMSKEEKDKKIAMINLSIEALKYQYSLE